ncbi:MAG TPA: GatB/YqeY domain-containing protein [Chloroflexota bacterium]
MRSGHTIRLNTIRMLRNAIQQADLARVTVTVVEDEPSDQHRMDWEDDKEKELTVVDLGPLSEEELEDVLTKQIKQRRDSMAVYKKAGRDDLYDKEAAELEVLLAYQPQTFSAIEMEAMVRNAIMEVGATSPRETGKVMGKLAPQLREKKVDMGAVREIAERLLAEGGEAPAKG